LLLVSENMFVEETYRPQSLTTVIIAVSVWDEQKYFEKQSNFYTKYLIE
jgi:hypothetical protein